MFYFLKSIFCMVLQLLSEFAVTHKIILLVIKINIKACICYQPQWSLIVADCQKSQRLKSQDKQGEKAMLIDILWIIDSELNIRLEIMDLSVFIKLSSKRERSCNVQCYVLECNDTTACLDRKNLANDSHNSRLWFKGKKRPWPQLRPASLGTLSEPESSTGNRFSQEFPGSIENR